MALRLKIPADNRPIEVVQSERPARPEVPLDRRIGVSIEGFAQLLSVSAPTVRELLKAGLPHLRCGRAQGRIVILPSLALRWLQSRAVSQHPANNPISDDLTGPEIDEKESA